MPTRNRLVLLFACISLLARGAIAGPARVVTDPSLGEFQLSKGDTLQAIACYQRALEVDPKLAHASEMLQKIQVSRP